MTPHGAQAAQRKPNSAPKLELRLRLCVVDIGTLCYFSVLKIIQPNGQGAIVSSPSFPTKQFGVPPAHPFTHGTQFYWDYTANSLTFITTLSSGLSFRYEYGTSGLDQSYLLYSSIQPSIRLPIDGSTGGYTFNRFVRDTLPMMKFPYP